MVEYRYTHTMGNINNFITKIKLHISLGEWNYIF